MNTIWKRIGGVIAIILSVVVFLASVGGVVGLWVLQGSAHDFTTAIFAPVESGLDTVNNALDKANTRFTDARAKVSNAQQFVGQLGQDPIFNGVVLGAISDTVGTKVGPQIDQAQESVGNAVELATGVNNSLVAINRLPGVNLPTLTDQIQALQTRTTTVGDRVQQARSDLNAMAQGKLQVAGSRINTLLANLDSALQDVQTAINKQATNFQDLQSRVATLKSNISSGINIGWLVGTIFLLWIAVTQVVMLVYSWSLVTSKPKEVAAPATPTTPAAGGDIPSTSTAA